jgi:hypothetical protein
LKRQSYKLFKTPKLELHFDYIDFFEKFFNRRYFFKDFPVFFDILKDISFIYQDPQFKDITTFIFGNNSLSPENFFNSEHAFVNFNYKIQPKEYCDLFLKKFLSIYNSSFSKGFKVNLSDDSLKNFNQKFFYGSSFTEKDLFIFLNVFFIHYNEQLIFNIFKNIDKDTLSLLLKRFFKISVNKTSKDCDLIAEAILSPNYFNGETLSVKLIDIFSRETFTFLVKNFKSLHKSFSKNTDSLRFLKYLFFFIYDEIIFCKRFSGGSIEPIDFRKIIFADSSDLLKLAANLNVLKVNPYVALVPGLDTMLEKEYARFTQKLNVFYNQTFPQKIFFDYKLFKLIEKPIPSKD